MLAFSEGSLTTSDDWGGRLRAGFNAGRTKKRAVRLPALSSMVVSGMGEHAEITLSGEAVTANMQTNAAAFEGWALALRRWAGAETVSLAWSEPQPDSSGRIDPHYERLMYRAARFAELFPWFELRADTGTARGIAEDASLRRLLNTPAQRKGLKAASLAARRDHRAWSGEREMECSLRGAAGLISHFGLVAPRFDQQFPVGLFGVPISERRVKEADRIFPGGKGAIDLVCADGDRFWLFELKAGDNIPLGAISELLFYTSVMRDARRGHFDFADGAWAHCDVTGQDVKSAREFLAVLLGDSIHPLLDDPTIWRDLNQAVETNWNAAGRPRVEFRAAKTTVDGFSDVAPPPKPH